MTILKFQSNSFSINEYCDPDKLYMLIISSYKKSTFEGCHLSASLRKKTRCRPYNSSKFLKLHWRNSRFTFIHTSALFFVSIRWSKNYSSHCTKLFSSQRRLKLLHRAQYPVMRNHWAAPTQRNQEIFLGEKANFQALEFPRMTMANRLLQL